MLVALAGPAALYGEQLVELGRVGGPDDVGGLVRIYPQDRDGGQVGGENRSYTPPASELSGLARAAS
jgi:hypothetical protein